MTLRLMVWNVQHGSANTIETPNGKIIAIDLGAGDGSQGGFSPLQHLWDCGIRKLDQVIITHPHLDHIDDILYFDSFSPSTFRSPKHLTEGDIRYGNPNWSDEAEAKIQKYLAIRRSYTTPVSPQDNVCLPQNNGGVSIQAFTPVQASRSNLNNHSVVTILEYCGAKILIPGDNEPPSWQELLDREDFVQAISGAHVLVAPHHGRESGFYRPLFNHFHPYVTIISDGREVDTSATARYSNVTRKWPVRRRRDGSERQRTCVTTRADGHIEVLVTPNPPYLPTLEVTVD